MTIFSLQRPSMAGSVFRWLGVGLLLPVAWPALAWNGAGHRLIAVIAWENLDLQCRATVGGILRLHPDYERWLARAKGSDPDFVAFTEASTWPDDIRHDKRFYSAGEEEATAPTAGFPDMERRRHWHYVDRPIGEGSQERSVGVLDTQLADLIRTLGDRRTASATQAYLLPWLMHLVGDAHQPLHTASRYGTNGLLDRGGNEVPIDNPFDAQNPSTNLHYYWDGLPGPPWLRDGRLESLAKSLIARHPPPTPPGNPEQWLAESWRIARDEAYPAQIDSVATISAEFHARATMVAHRRIAEAGYRLAELLRRLLRE